MKHVRGPPLFYYKDPNLVSDKHKTACKNLGKGRSGPSLAKNGCLMSKMVEGSILAVAISLNNETCHSNIKCRLINGK